MPTGEDLPVLVPAAGRGSRLRPATKYVSKPMLPVGNRPLIEFVLREIDLAGCSRVVVIVDPEDLALQDFVRRVDFDLELQVVEQPRALGLADALLRGFRALPGIDKVAFALPDNVVLNGQGIGSLLPAPSGDRLCFGLTAVSRQEAPFFGSSGLFTTPDELPPEKEWISITELQSKGEGRFSDNSGEWPLWRTVPRGILPARFFELVAETEPDPDSHELDDVPVYRKLLAEKPALGRPLDGEIYDTGEPESFLRFCSKYFELAEKERGF